jgi:phage terminase large subunit-like protein
MAADLRALVASLGKDQVAAVMAGLSDEDAEVLLHDWRGVWARPEQLAPGTPGASDPRADWTTWVINAGRGFGKTRSGAEFVREKVDSGEWRHVALVAKTPRDARKVMLEGESGLLSIWPASMRPVYNPSLAQVTFWNGATAGIYSDEVPDQLRGPQHHGAWVDEFAKFRNPRDTWDQLMLGLRLGRRPQAIVTTTPRPLDVYVELMKEASTIVTRGSTMANLANLAKPFADYVVRRYAGTRLGRQELDAEVLADAEGALWSRDLIDRGRVTRAEVPGRATGIVGPDGKEAHVYDFLRLVVAVDPAVTSKPGVSDETGIVVVALARNGHGYVLDDATGLYTPEQWARRAIELYEAWRADLIVGEVNNGGDLVERNLRTWEDEEGRKRGKNVSYKSVKATRGKEVRAEPVKSLYEQRRLHHVGIIGELEDEMCTWVPGETEKSPNRVDALVWGATELMVDPSAELRVRRFA